MISFDQVSVHYGEVCALEEVTLSLASGRLIALVGQNGSGKTTMLKAIAGLVNPTGGSLELNGAPIDLSSGYTITAVARRSNDAVRRTLAVTAVDLANGQYLISATTTGWAAGIYDWQSDADHASDPICMDGVFVLKEVI